MRRGWIEVVAFVSKTYPKQLLNLVSKDRRLIQDTCNRILDRKDLEGLVIVCSALSFDIIKQQVEEEVGKNTVVIGMDECIIVNTRDAILIMDSNKSHDVKKIYNKLKIDDPDST